MHNYDDAQCAVKFCTFYVVMANFMKFSWCEIEIFQKFHCVKFFYIVRQVCFFGVHASYKSIIGSVTLKLRNHSK